MNTVFQDQLQAAIGTTYVFERELGGGGMSRVFLAHETALGRKVVVKVLLPELAAGVNVERFRREIQLAAQLQHPHIVPLLAAGEAEKLPYLVMPFVAGESLRARVIREGELPIPETVRILRDVVSALAYAHGFGVVHRDVKPDNVLLSGGVAVVTDFGVAKAITASSEPASSGLTSLGVALGTPAYMAPEQATASPQVDHRADLYALGAMAYELLTGQPPFAGRTAQAMLAAHLVEDPEPVERRRGAVPPQLAALVRDCLAKRPADRPQNAATVINILDSIATPTGGTAATTAVRISPSQLPAVSRRRWLLPAAIFGLVAVAGGAALLLQRGRSVAPASAPKPDSVVPGPAAAVPPPEAPGSTSTASTAARPAPSPVKREPPRRSPRVREPIAAPTPAPPTEPASEDTTQTPAPNLGPVTPAPPPTEPAESASPPPPVAVPKPPTAVAPVPPPAADTQREIRDLVARYASAIEAGSVAGLQRVYPGMTGGQQRGWEQFFQLVRNVKADLSIGQLQMGNNAAEGQVVGTYSYLNTSTGRAERQPVSFRASFRHDAGQWRISQIR